METHHQKPTIVITGGNFVNKGAESMLMSTVDAIRTHFPGYEPVLLDLFPTIKASDKGNYPFRIVNMHVRSLFRICFPILKLFFKKKDISADESEIKNVIKSASAIFDISGYGISSHNQQMLWSVVYLLPIYMAKKNGVPVWLLPQSMGPFQFCGAKKWLFQLFAIPLIQYPEVVFIREPSGFEAVKKIRIKQTVLSQDIVLQVQNHQNDDSNNPGEGVLVIPNQQLFRFVGQEETLRLYENLIIQVLNQSIPVTVIQHSSDDQVFCKLLEKKISHNLFRVDYKVLSLEALHKAIKSSRFVITGRYHGAIHALKLHRPIIIVGWAEKYRHLATMFGIENLLIDLSSDKLGTGAEGMVQILLTEELALRDKIQKQMRLIVQDNIWKRIHLKP